MTGIRLANLSLSTGAARTGPLLLKAPLQGNNGELVPRDSGTPQGGVVSPLLANLFLHYAFDAWVRRVMHGFRFVVMRTTVCSIAKARSRRKL